MFGSSVLEVAIALVTVYLVLSLVCSAIAEAWAQLFATRSRNLREAIARLMGEEPSKALKPAESPRTARFYDDPRIVALKGKVVLTNQDRDPSYINRETFARTAVDVIAGTDRPMGAHELRAKLVERELESAGSGDDAPAATMRRFLDEARGDMLVFGRRVERWFDDSMERASGWYRRRTRIVLILAGLVVAGLSNADTFRIVRLAQQNPALREALVAQASGLAEHADVEDVDFREIREEAAEIEPILGWTWREWEQVASADAPVGDGTRTTGTLLSKIVGLVVTAIALSLGAPFWFNALQWLLKIRNSVRPDDEERLTPAETGAPVGETVTIVDGDPATDERGRIVAAVDRFAMPDALRTGAVGFRPTETTADLLNDWWMARLSLLAYEDAATIRRTLHGWSLVGDAHPFRVHEAVDTQAIVADGGAFAVVAFRGTEPTRHEDVLTDLRFRLREARFVDPSLVHEGFRDALEPFWSTQLLPLVDDLVERPRALWFTGHSLGGALAVLAGARVAFERSRRLDEAETRLAEIERSEGDGDERRAAIEAQRRVVHALRSSTVVGIRTFGQPRVGDGDFAKAAEELLGERITRYVNHLDAVPRLPPRRFGYTHLGSVVVFDAFGEPARDPSLWRRFLDTVVVSPDDVRAMPLELVQDHSMRAYLDLMERSLRDRGITPPA